jgi:hypothetical protein
MRVTPCPSAPWCRGRTRARALSMLPLNPIAVWEEQERCHFQRVTQDLCHCGDQRQYASLEQLSQSVQRYTMISPSPRMGS